MILYFLYTTLGLLSYLAAITLGSCILYSAQDKISKSLDTHERNQILLTALILFFITVFPLTLISLLFNTLVGAM